MQIVGEQQTGHQQQPGFADLPVGSNQLIDAFGHSIGQPHDVLFLTIVTGNVVAPSVESDAHLAHGSLFL